MNPETEGDMQEEAPGPMEDNNRDMGFDSILDRKTEDMKPDELAKKEEISDNGVSSTKDDSKKGDDQSDTDKERFHTSIYKTSIIQINETHRDSHATDSSEDF